MSETSSIARPYAKAIFELARDAGDYAQWSNQLDFLTAVATDSAMAEILQNPAISNEQLSQLLLDVGKDQLDEEGQNFVKLLVQNDRVSVVKAINTQFQILRDEAEQIIEAQLITAAKVDDSQKKSIESALSKRLGKKIKLETSVDESLIGGAVVRAGDWVVDGSVKAQLQDLVGAIGA